MQILALHGFTGSGADFELFAPLIEEKWHCPDLPGHGDSQNQDCSPEATQSLIQQKYEGLPRGRKVIVGYSMGARAALNHAILNPQQWDGMILISANPGIENEPERLARRRSDEKLAQRIESDGIDQFLEFWQQQPLMLSQQKIRSDWLTVMLANRRTNSTQGLAHSLRSFGQGSCPNRWPQLQQLKMPVLCLTGEFDAKYRRINERIIKQIPRAEHSVIRDVGHMPHLENPSICAPTINRFLKTLK